MEATASTNSQLETHGGDDAGHEFLWSFCLVVAPLTLFKGVEEVPAAPLAAWPLDSEPLSQELQTNAVHLQGKRDEAWFFAPGIGARSHWGGMFPSKMIVFRCFGDTKGTSLRIEYCVNCY